jgi:hypothetical protein
MAAVTGVWNELAGKQVDRLATNASSAGSSSSSSGTTATIAANDFLTLLVTEMKNQDPTATTDPNEYVNQLVQVNSLQQLISINETLQDAVVTTPKTDIALRATSTEPIINGPPRTDGRPERRASRAFVIDRARRSRSRLP